MKHPATHHAGITYPTTVYQKTVAPPGYVAVPVATEAEHIALEGPTFLTPIGALKYVAPPEQPCGHVARTDNFEQFVPGKSVMGVESSEPVIRERTAPNVYLRGQLQPPDPPPDPPAIL